MVKNFILECHKDIENQEFFIIDDIDTALPTMFTETGVVYGAFSEKVLAAVHGIDFSYENHALISPHVPSYLTDKPLAELGWTMVKSTFRGYGLATFLIAESEKNVPEGYNLIATTHPQNVAALKAYIRNGYCGVKLGEYYGKPRVFMMKRTDIPFAYEKTITEGLLEEMNQESFLGGNMLVGIVKKNGKYYGQFAKVLQV